MNHSCMYGYMIGGWINGCTNLCNDEWMDLLIDRWIYRLMHGFIDAWMDLLIDA